MVSSQERPENSPLYSIHTDLDSFILYNDDISNEQELINETSTKLVAIIDEEENKEETKRQFASSENHSKEITSIKHQNNHEHSTNQKNQRKNPQDIENIEEQNEDKHCAILQEQNSHKLGQQNREDHNEINEKSENSPL